MPPESFVTSHIHVDGPIPGPHSLLTVASTAHLAGGVLTDVFRANLRVLPGASLHPIAMAEWRRQPEDWLTTRRAARPPTTAMNDLTSWLAGLPGPPVFVADPAGPEYLFLYWYLQRFTGCWPFVRMLPATPAPDRSTHCPLTRCRERTAPLARVG